MLVAIVIVALAAVFAASAVAAVAGGHRIAAADRGAARADAAVWQALDAQAERLRRRPWLADVPPETDAPPSLLVEAVGEARGSRSRLRALLELRLPAWCGGLVSGADAQLEAPVTVAQSGAYFGGSLRGREQLAFAPAPAVPGLPGPADLVHGDLWPEAAAHALGGIWAADVEVHDDPGAPDPAYAGDTDTHTGSGAIVALTAGPYPALLAALSAGAVHPGAALVDGVLDVTLLPDTPPGVTAGDTARMAAGFVVLVPAAATPVTVVGERHPDACPLALVVCGDARAAGAAAGLSLRGALVVCGRLVVAGESSVQGSLYAGSLLVQAPLTVSTAPGWRHSPLAGLATLVIARLERL